MKIHLAFFGLYDLHEGHRPNSSKNEWKIVRVSFGMISISFQVNLAFDLHEGHKGQKRPNEFSQNFDDL